MHNQRDF